MKRQLITYTLAAFCATAILSCNKEAAIDSIGPDTERTVLLTASIDASTKAVSIDESEVACVWAVGETVALVHGDAVISTLEVISVSGNKAQLSGKVKGAYNVGTAMMLYYGGTSYDYSGQTGTAESAVSRGYLTAGTSIKAQDGKTLTLESVTMEHKQAYMSLSFYKAATPVKVKSVEITDGGDQIVKTQALGGSPVLYDTEKFTVAASTAEGQESFYFALNDQNATAHPYTLTIIAADDKTYTGTVAAPTAVGNYFADSKVILVRISPVITAPTVYSYMNYDGLPHNLVIPAVLQPGAIAYYGVSNLVDSVPSDSEWSTLVPTRIDPGSYTVWYKVEGGDFYDDILPTKVGTTFIRPMEVTTIDLPSVATGLHAYDATSQALINSDGAVKVGTTPVSGAELQYYVKKKEGATDPTPPTGEEATGWSSTIPERIDAGEYHIWCRYLGDSSHLPAMSGPRIVTIEKRNVSVTANNQTISIGQAFDTSVTGATLAGQVSGHTLFSVTLTPSIVDTSVAATGTMTIGHDAVIKAGDIDVTHNYAIAYSNGTIEVH